MRHVLDRHAALGRGDDRDPRGLAVDQEGQVEFLGDVRAVLDVDAVDLLAGLAGLDGDEGAAQHLAGEFGGLSDRAGEADAALLAGFGLLEVALAAATGVDLRLHHPERPVEFAGSGLGVFGLQDDAAVRDRDAVAAQQCFRLVFVDVHGAPPR
jgi:hypothetical protein